MPLIRPSLVKGFPIHVGRDVIRGWPFSTHVPNGLYTPVKDNCTRIYPFRGIACPNRVGVCSWGGGSKKGTPTQILNLGSLSKCMFTINIYKYKEREGGGGPTGWGYPNSFRLFVHTRRTYKAVGTTSSKPPLHPPPYHPRILES